MDWPEGVVGNKSWSAKVAAEFLLTVVNVSDEEEREEEEKEGRSRKSRSVVECRHPEEKQQEKMTKKQPRVSSQLKLQNPVVIGVRQSRETNEPECS